MEKTQPKITEFFNSKGRTMEEAVGITVEGDFEQEQVRLDEPWWKTTIHTFKRVTENGHK